MINFPHPKVMICLRFVKFSKTVANCNKLSVRLLANLCKDDQKTVFGRYLLIISSDCNIERNMLTPTLLQNVLTVREEEMLLDNFNNP